MLIRLVGIILLLALGGNATDPRQCISELLTVPMNDDSALDAAAVLDSGFCVNAADFGVPCNIASSNPMPTLNQTLACSVKCFGEQPEQLVIQFLWAVDKCICVPANDEVPVDQGNATVCPPYEVPLVTLSLACPMNLSLCGELDGCGVVDGCCQPTNSSSTGAVMPTYYRIIVQWVAIVVISLALLEGLVYAIVRRRVRAMGFHDNDLQTSLIQRDKDEALALSTQLMNKFPESPLRQEDNVPDDQKTHCSICLEGLTEQKAVELPCKHLLHAACLQEYMGHHLRNQNAVQCPMCRASVVSEEDTNQATDRHQEL